MQSDADRLLEPSKAYKEFYKDQFSSNAEEAFERLVEKSGINREENKTTAAKYRKAADSAKLISRKRGRLKALRVFLIVLAVICAFISVYGMTQGDALTIIIPLAVAIISLVLIFALINSKIKALTELIDKHSAEAEKLLAEANAQMAPLNRLFDSAVTAELIEKTVPTLVVDKRFDMKRYDYMHGKYGLGEEPDRDTSTLGVLSGEILGNPYLFERTLNRRIGSQVYTGMITIHWTTYSRDSEGRSVAQHHSQVLTAHVTKPKPFFDVCTRLIYGNEAAPDLSFTHKKTHAENFSEKKLKSTVKSRMKKIRKHAEKNISGGFTEMGNEEFDALFGATDRDNEVQFRLLFTPLAQKNMLELMKGGSPFGDDFDFYKRKCLNTVVSEHSQDWDMECDVSKYVSYDADISKKAFMDFNKSYFEHFYFDLAPMLAVPLYQQHKPAEYIYQTSYSRNYTAREAEIIANKFGVGFFAHPASRTQAILKTCLMGKDDDVDKLEITAYSYRTVHRVDVIPVFGGDGRMHAVPVPWIEYIPVSKKTEMSVKSLDMSDKDYKESKYASESVAHIFSRRLFATLGNDGILMDDAPDEIDDDGVDYGDVIEEAVESGFNEIEDLANDDNE